MLQYIAVICIAFMAVFFFIVDIQAENPPPVSSDSGVHLTQIVLNQPLNVGKLFGRWKLCV